MTADAELMQFIFMECNFIINNVHKKKVADRSGHTTCLLPIFLTGGTSCCCDICPTRYTTRPMTSPIGVCARAGVCGQKKTPRVDCLALTLVCGRYYVGVYGGLRPTAASVRSLARGPISDRMHACNRDHIRNYVACEYSTQLVVVYATT